MAGSTYLSLANQALVAMNEVPLTASTFGAAQGLQSLVLNAVNYSINNIYQQIRQLPWAYSRDTSITLTIGTGFYTWPTGTLEVDYDGIAINNYTSGSTNIPYKVLRQIQHEEWKRRYQEADLDTIDTNYGLPQYVFRTPDNKIGISVPPDATYNLVVPLWSLPTPLAALTDTVAIPSLYDLNILDGTMYYVYVLRQNEEALKRQEPKVEKAIKALRAATTNKYLSMQDTRVVGNS